MGAQSKSSGGNTFELTFSVFNAGQGPVAHLDSLTEIGGGGHYSVGTNIDVISLPGVLTQGPGLSTLTAGTEAGAITELVNFILDRPPVAGFTFGIAATKLHKISASAVTNAGIWPHAITSAVAGSSVIEADGNLYYFFNKSAAGEIGKYDLNVTFTDNWGSTVPSGAAALQKADHPVATKQDIILFGNGQYVGTYIISTNTLAATKLDFKANSLVADVCFNANQWWIAVNKGSNTSTDRTSSQIYTYDGAAISAILADEVAVGIQKIGWIMPIEGVIYAAFQDLSSAGGYCIGYVSGRQLKPLRYFTGALPTFAQKTLYENMIIFLSGNSVYAIGASIETLPVQISQLASAGFTTAGALAAPFGTPMVASTQSTSFKLAKFSGYDVNCAWKSIIIALSSPKQVGVIDYVEVLTRALGSSASMTLKIESNQASVVSPAMTVTGTGKRRFSFTRTVTNIEDFRIALDWSGGSTTNPVPVRRIKILGHFKEA